MRMKNAEEHQEAINFFPARNPSADGFANCDSRETVASDVSDERHPPVRLGEQGSCSVRMSSLRAIETRSIILLVPHRVCRSLPCVSVAQSMRGASSRKLGMHAHSTRILRPDSRPTGSVVPDAGTPESCESPSVRPFQKSSWRDPSVIGLSCVDAPSDTGIFPCPIPSVGSSAFVCPAR